MGSLKTSHFELLGSWVVWYLAYVTYFSCLLVDCKVHCELWKGLDCIVWTALFQGGRSKFWLPPSEERICKINTSGWKYGAGVGVLIKGRVGWHFSYLIFSRFIIFTFRYYFTFLQNCFMHLKKNYFFLPP